jgi:hypothetical protein
MALHFFSDERLKEGAPMIQAESSAIHLCGTFSGVYDCLSASDRSGYQFTAAGTFRQVLEDNFALF